MSKHKSTKCENCCYIEYKDHPPTQVENYHIFTEDETLQKYDRSCLLEVVQILYIITAHLMQLDYNLFTVGLNF